MRDGAAPIEHVFECWCGCGSGCVRSSLQCCGRSAITPVQYCVCVRNRDAPRLTASTRSLAVTPHKLGADFETTAAAGRADRQEGVPTDERYRTARVGGEGVRRLAGAADSAAGAVGSARALSGDRTVDGATAVDRARAGAAAQGAGLRVRGLAAGPDGDLVDVELTVTDPATVAKLTPRGGCGYSFGFTATGAPTATFTVPDPDAVARVHASLDALFAAGRERGEIR